MIYRSNLTCPDLTPHFKHLFCTVGPFGPIPLQDAQGAHQHLTDNGVIVFHDFIGTPVQQAVAWLIQQGYKYRIYTTPQMVAWCWRGNFEPPEHVPDPAIRGGAAI